MSKTIRIRLKELKENQKKIAENLAFIGAAGQSKDGLAELANKALQAVVVRGEVKTAKVSSVGTIFQGDRIRKVKEFESKNEIRFALDDVNVIATKKICNNYLVVIFCQEDNTYLKTLHYNGSVWTLGNTLLLIEGDVLLTASIVVLSATAIAVLYGTDAGGLLSRVTISGTTATLDYTDIFEAYDPVNIVAANDPSSNPNTIAVSFVRHSTDFAGKTYLLAITVNSSYITLGTPVELLMTDDEGHPVDLNYSKDEYVKSWTIAVYKKTIYLSFYHGSSFKRGLVVASINARTIKMKRHSFCELEGSLPSAAMEIIPNSTVAGSVAIAHAITRIQSSTTKSMLGFEIWHGLEECDKLLPLCFSEEDITYSVNVGRICVGSLDSNTLFAGYSINDAMRLIAIDLNNFYPIGGPSIAVCNFHSFAEVVPLTSSYAVVVYQKDGNGYAKALSISNVVISSTEGKADGVAKTGGSTGSNIQIYDAT